MLSLSHAKDVIVAGELGYFIDQSLRIMSRIQHFQDRH